VDEEDPWRSRLLLGPGSSPPGSLALADLAEGVWESNLVVLSGCATGRGRVFRSEGAISLARACLVSGSRSVLTTLWPVADRTAAEFMRAFYDSLPACGGEVAPALMEARRRLRANAAFASPFHWAGFVLYGLPDPIPAPAASNGWSSVFLLVWATLLLLWLVRIAQSLRGGGRP
jgi:CHAT domain-containing protein